MSESGSDGDPIPILAVPLLLQGFGFLTVLVLVTLAVVLVCVGWMLIQGLREVHGLSGRDAGLTLGATFAVWLGVALYLGSNLA